MRNPSPFVPLVVKNTHHESLAQRREILNAFSYEELHAGFDFIPPIDPIEKLRMQQQRTSFHEED